MKRSTLQLIFILPLTAALAIACAPDKNKKDRLTRISGRSKIITQKPQTQADQNKTIATPAETAGATPVAAEPTVATVVDGTELCRITDDPALDEAFIEQAFCDGMDVDVEADGKII
ncbi:MAG: hypothetical protein KDD38_00905, partial [Bdellovibrionales bacterium]|nr:hypothetical protein [Bdellovibrionales bacterium]